jgi:hypothetical protein
MARNIVLTVAVALVPVAVCAARANWTASLKLPR